MNRHLSIPLTILGLAVCGLLLSATTTQTAGAGPGGAQPQALSAVSAPGVQPTLPPVQVQVINTPLPVTVGNFPANQNVNVTNPSLPVTVGNFPSSQTVNGTVNIGNFPTNQNVQVTNTANSPVQVSNADTPERHAFQMFGYVQVTQTPVAVLHFTVPAGKRFVIETITAKIDVEPIVLEGVRYLDLYAHSTVGGNTGQHFLKVDRINDLGTLVTSYRTQESVRLYADDVPNQTDDFDLIASVIGGFDEQISIQASLSGYLIDLP